MIRFYAPDIDSTCCLPESDSQHAVRVLRMREGDELQVIDGKGGVMKCRIVDAHPKHTAVEILGRTHESLPWQQEIAVAVAPTKHMDRMEWMVEKLTEIGVDRIIPMLCERSERKEIKTERLEKIAVSAMKQSLKATLPEISPMIRFRDLVGMMQGARKYIGYCDRTLPVTDFAGCYVPQKSTLIMIGPEGDFSPAEIALALDRDILPVTFGRNRLRTETAAVYGVAACHILDDATANVPQPASGQHANIENNHNRHA